MQRIALKIFLGVLPLLIGSVPQVHAQSAMYATSGGGRTGASAARLSAMQTVQQRHLEAMRECTNIGKLYAPAASEADVNGCIATANPCGDAGMIHGPNFEASLVDSFGCVQTVKSNYAVDGSETETNVQILDFVKARHIVDGMDETRVLEIAANVEALPPVENNHAATKEYVDTALAAGGGGGGSAPICSITRQLYNGSLGGLAGADAKCEEEFGAGWRMASNGGLYAVVGANISGVGWTHHPSRGGTYTCGNWATISGGAVGHTGTDINYYSGCGTNLPIFCCNF